jgi:hypothetical protein
MLAKITFTSASLEPKRTLRGSTVVASKVLVVRMATGITPLPLGLMLLEELPRLMSI